MNLPPSTSSEQPKPISSPRRTLPEAPPSYYDFPPSYTANSDVVTDELPAYCLREFPGAPSRPCTQNVPQPPLLPPQRVFTVLPRQAYAIRMQRRRTLRQPPPDNYIRRRLNLLVGTFFILLLATVILVLTILMTFWPITPKMHNSKEDLDRFYSTTPKHSRGPSSSITIPPHGIIPAVYAIETGSYYNQSNPSDYPQEASGIHKTVKIAFVLIVLTILLVGFVFATLSVTKLAKT